MASAVKPIFIFLVYLSLHLSLIKSKSQDPTPAEWPLQFHSILFMNNSGTLQKVDLWYDWPNSRNFNIIQNQLGKLTYDLEWDNGTSYIYTLDSNKECKVLHFPVGILRPDWLDGANYLGQQEKDGFLCNVWEKVDFIWYYEDVITKRPVFWAFYTGYTAHVMTFEVGAVLEDSQWQAPVYCFKEAEEEKTCDWIFGMESSSPGEADKKDFQCLYHTVIFLTKIVLLSGYNSVFFLDPLNKFPGVFTFLAIDPWFDSRNVFFLLTFIHCQLKRV